MQESSELRWTEVHGEPREDRLAPGARLGPYAIERYLARGGMSDVYVARGRDGARVALKVIALERGELTTVARELEHEGRAAMRIQHANVAAVLDVGLASGRAYLAMQLVEGVSVRDLLSAIVGGQIEVPTRVRLHVVAGAARGLHAAHEATDEHGVSLALVHRDVSPSNVLLAQSGAVQIIDFGIAKTRERATQTHFGVVKGKLSYMSPEQASGLPLDRRSDVFSLGIVLFELLAQHKLFAAPSLPELRRVVVRAEIPKVAAPPEIAPVLASMLARDRQARPPHALAVAEALERVLLGDEEAALARIVAQVHAAAVPRAEDDVPDDDDLFDEPTRIDEV